MKQNIVRLFYEYQSATGNTIKLGDKESESAFFRWYQNKRILDISFRNFLELNGFEVRDRSCIEVGSTFYSSIVLPYTTTILTNNPEMFDKAFRERIINGKLVFKDDKLYILSDTDDGPKMNLIDKNMFDTFLITNVLEEKNIINWDLIHNNQLGSIIVGAYGNTSDKDRIYKLTMLKRLREKLSDYDYLENHLIADDEYFYILGSVENLSKHC